MTDVNGSRRERLRAATITEIKTTARGLLVEHGPQSVTVRAIARAMGMTAPALYRYFASFDELLGAVVCDVYAELGRDLQAARDAVPNGDVARQLVAISLSFRTWAVEHPQEFGLVFGSPLPRISAGTEVHEVVGRSFGAVFAEAFVELWRRSPFPVPEEGDLPSDLVVQLKAFRENLAGNTGTDLLTLPIGAAHIFVQAWVRLYGVVAMEVFGHLGFCLEDSTPFFETQLAEIAQMVGVTDPELVLCEIGLSRQSG